MRPMLCLFFYFGPKHPNELIFTLIFKKICAQNVVTTTIFGNKTSLLHKRASLFIWCFINYTTELNFRLKLLNRYSFIQLTTSFWIPYRKWKNLHFTKKLLPVTYLVYDRFFSSHHKLPPPTHSKKSMIMSQ